MDRNEVLAAIDRAYAARQANDGEALSHVWAEGATFEIAGEASLLANFPGTSGPSASQPAIEELMRLVAMSGVSRQQAVVEGNKAAVLSRATVSFAGRAPFETLLYDLWEFDEAGKVRSLIQFVDTAQVVTEMRALAAA